MQTLSSILLIDDDPPTNFLHTHLLRKIGYTGEVHEVYTAEMAMAFMRATAHPPVQLVFLDLNMPKANGWEFLQLYAQEFSDRERTIVALTTSLDPDDERRAHDSPFVDAFCRKPLTREVVIDLLATKFTAFWEKDS